ncbi:hypothetical protein [Sphingomonas sp. MS122]|uniref:hypothetical protein n=1 Tax=Sphingomonas sp. MS122 TaxID=3412683 RepID=UPI003C2E530D
MSIRLLTYLLLFAQIAIALAVLMLLIMFVIPIASGEPFTASWPVVANAATASFPLSGGQGAIRIDRGTLELATSDWKPAFVQLVTFGVLATGSYAAIDRLKTVLAGIAAGKPFADDIIRSLRVIGWLLIGWVALDIVHALIAQPLFLAAAQPAEGVALGASISSLDGAEPARAFRLVYELDWIRIAAGLFVLALAQAFATGKALAADNAAII